MFADKRDTIVVGEEEEKEAAEDDEEDILSNDDEDTPDRVFDELCVTSIIARREHCLSNCEFCSHARDFSL